MAGADDSSTVNFTQRESQLVHGVASLLLVKLQETGNVRADYGMDIVDLSRSIPRQSSLPEEFMITQHVMQKYKSREEAQNSLSVKMNEKMIEVRMMKALQNQLLHSNYLTVKLEKALKQFTDRNENPPQELQDAFYLAAAEKKRCRKGVDLSSSRIHELEEDLNETNEILQAKEMECKKMLEDIDMQKQKMDNEMAQMQDRLNEKTAELHQSKSRCEELHKETGQLRQQVQTVKEELETVQSELEERKQYTIVTIDQEDDLRKSQEEVESLRFALQLLQQDWSQRGGSIPSQESSDDNVQLKRENERLKRELRAVKSELSYAQHNVEYYQTCVSSSIDVHTVRQGCSGTDGASSQQSRGTNDVHPVRQGCSGTDGASSQQSRDLKCRIPVRGAGSTDTRPFPAGPEEVSSPSPEFPFPEAPVDETFALTGIGSDDNSEAGGNATPVGTLHPPM